MITTEILPEEHIGMRANVTLPFALLVFLVTSEGRAGACAEAIDLAQSQIDARIDTVAGAGPSAPESRAATTHHQPTPGSIVAEEIRLGEGAKTQAALAALARARIADNAGDKSACESALAEVEIAIRP